MPWREWTAKFCANDGWDIGGRTHDRHGNTMVRGSVPWPPESKYMPHNGKREMERRRRRMAA